MKRMGLARHHQHLPTTRGPSRAAGGHPGFKRLQQHSLRTQHQTPKRLNQLESPPIHTRSPFPPQPRLTWRRGVGMVRMMATSPRSRIELHHQQPQSRGGSPKAGLPPRPGSPLPQPLATLTPTLRMRRQPYLHHHRRHQQQQQLRLLIPPRRPPLTDQAVGRVNPRAPSPQGRLLHRHPGPPPLLVNRDEGSHLWY